MAELVDIAPGILVHTSRREALNSVVLASISEAMLVDPGWEADELDDIASQLSERGLAVISGFATHAHHNHVLWHPAFGSAPRLASEATVRLAAAERDELLMLATADDSSLASRPDLRDLFGHLSPTPQAPADSHHTWLPKDAAPDGFDPQLLTHDAHIPGHTALWIPEQRILIAGDMLSSTELPLPDLDHVERRARTLQTRKIDPFTAYLEALTLLEPYAREARLVIPGHGPLGADALERLERDRAYLMSILEGGDPLDERRATPEMEAWHARLLEGASGRK
ncbi:MBL fold metallo-hydrolase [Dermabacter sp. p3-SID358]|uniref:MBL fold metallo-hydrolase n=1 Tax=Dermabacter sp. p3-SID358 TaxID=2916114 RepID=UPI0021A59940|nr:MBL fold metallo-hydrolase [Dermabacter sp. p3-SID358]MCT1867643.1 MBL fold metallo-hydrolase [Dermabacter sp. p3-SID358]